MKRLSYSTEEEWHEIRRSHIGGSEIASLFNVFLSENGQLFYRHLFEETPDYAEFIGSLSPYCSGVRLWHEKKGNIPVEPFDNPRTQAGKHLEPGIASWARERTGWDILKVEDYLVHESIDGMGASLDYEILDHPQGHTAMDCKEVRWDIWNKDWIESGEEPEPPLHIILQLHHQMACAELSHGMAAVYVAGHDLYLPEVPRNEIIIKRVEEAVTAFWNAIKQNREPDINYDRTVAEDLFLHVSITSLADVIKLS